MTIDLTEPFNNLTAWTTSGTVTVVAGGTAGTMAQTTSGSGNLAKHSIAAGNRTAIVEITFDYKASNLSLSGACLYLYSDGGTAQDITVQVASDGKINVYRGGLAGTLIASSAAGQVVAATFARLAVRVVLSDTVGQVRVKVNGTAVIDTAATLDTRVAAGTAFDTVAIVGNGSGVTANWDEMVIETFTSLGPAMPYVWNGSAFVRALTVKTWNGSAFVDAPAVKVWNGSAFVNAV